MIWDAVIAGGGPAGLAAAIRLRERGFTALLIDRAAPPIDKACGEGLMPRGLRELESLGARKLIDRARSAPFRGIRYVQEDGSRVEAHFTRGEGLGVRRLALAEALRSRAAALGADFRRSALRGFQQSDGDVAIDTDGGEVRARLLVGADGLHSLVRRAAGLEWVRAAPRRFGLRRHFALAPWTDLVEVHWHAGAEAYVTPVGPASINLAFLWDAAAFDERASWDSLLALFPALRDRLDGAAPESEQRGAGPLWQDVSPIARGRVALLGDAAGYVDAITGQGLSLALSGARLLAESLPAALDAADLQRALAAYQTKLRAGFRAYALPARSLLWLARHPALRRRAFRLCAAQPRVFAALLGHVAD